MDGIKLSILICTLPQRLMKLDRLLCVLEPQLNEYIEPIIDNTEGCVGTKRNNMIERAKGEYVSFVDDDDLVSDDYVSSILNAIESKPDVVGIMGIMLWMANFPRRFIHTIQCKDWYEADAVYYRTPNHLNPIRKDRLVSSGVRFPSKSFGEDLDFSRQLRGHLKTEVFLDKPIYYYLYEKLGMDEMLHRKLEA
jgi:glycosyltransferase involved in cell wall biosynthesis